jgi:hypothetical protein
MKRDVRPMELHSSGFDQPIDRRASIKLLESEILSNQQVTCPKTVRRGTSNEEHTLIFERK